MLQNLFYDYIVLEQGLSGNTVAAYRRDIEGFFAHFGSFVVSNEDVAKYLSGMQCAKSTLSRKISALKSLYKFLLLNRYVEFSPLDNIVKIKKKQTIPSYLTVEEIKILADSFRGDFRGVRDKLIFDILVYTGARVSEVVDLKLSDINVPNLSIKFLGKGEKIRIVPIHEFLMNSIRNYLKNIRNIFVKNIKDDRVFPNMSRNNFWHRIKKIYFKNSGIDKNIHPHIFRHSFATIMLNSGANIRYVQEILGHSSVSTTEIYTHVSKNKLKSVHDAIFRGKYEK